MTWPLLDLEEAHPLLSGPSTSTVERTCGSRGAPLGWRIATQVRARHRGKPWFCSRKILISPGQKRGGRHNQSSSRQRSKPSAPYPRQADLAQRIVENYGWEIGWFDRTKHCIQDAKRLSSGFLHNPLRICHRGLPA